MSAGFRSKVWQLARFSLLTAGIAGSALFPSLGVQAAAVSGPASAAPHTRTGLLTPAGTIDPIHPPAGGAALAAAPKTKTRAKGIQRLSAQLAGAATAGKPSVNAGGLDASPAGGLQQNFNGVGSLDSAVTNFGLEFEPPDQGLCVGNGVVLEPVNSAYTFYHRDGSLIAGPFNVNDLFGDPGLAFTTDPRCVYDQAANRWFAIIAFISDDNTVGRVEIAVSTTGDPTGLWTVYRLDATDDGSNGTPAHRGCPCFGDQPLLGIDSQNLYISTNEFAIIGPQANGAQIYAITKAELVAASSAHFVMFENLSLGGSTAFSVQPALTYSSTGAEFFLNSLDPNGHGDNRLGVWALTNPQAVAQGGVPNLSSLVIASEAYSIPPGAPQQGATSLLDAGDDRMQQTEFINGELWGELDTAVGLRHDASLRAGIAWFRVHPALAGQTLGSASIAGQGYLAAAGNSLLYPAIAAGADGLAAMVFTITGPNQFASAAYAVMSNDHSAFGEIHIAANGTGPYDPNAGRWGDYSWAAPDPSGHGLWFATEYIPPAASQTTDGRRNWGTRVFEVNAGGN